MDLKNISELTQIKLSDLMFNDYSKTFEMLVDYDNGKLTFPAAIPSTGIFNWGVAQSNIIYLREKLNTSQFFGLEVHNGQIKTFFDDLEQKFHQDLSYKTGAIKAVELLYFIVKNNPFINGNKIIGAWLFKIYLHESNIFFPINYHGLFLIIIRILEVHPTAEDRIKENLIHWIMISNSALRMVFNE